MAKNGILHDYDLDANKVDSAKNKTCVGYQTLVEKNY